MAKKKNRKRFTAEELIAWTSAYNEPMSKFEMYKIMLFPAVTFASIALLTLYIWWLVLLMFLYGLYFGWNILLPYMVRRQYETAAFRERNKFINNLTQLLMNENKSVFMCLQEAQSRTEGELGEDLSVLLSILYDASDKDKLKVFSDLSEKYEHDFVFGMFLEQVETLAIEGRTGIEPLKEIKTYHNSIREKSMDYETAKRNNLMDLRIIVLVLVIMVVTVAFGFGLTRYLDGFAWHPVGWLFGGLFVFLLQKDFKKFVHLYYDDDVMGVEM